EERMPLLPGRRSPSLLRVTERPPGIAGAGWSKAVVAASEDRGGGGAIVQRDHDDGVTAGEWRWTSRDVASIGRAANQRLIVKRVGFRRSIVCRDRQARRRRGRHRSRRRRDEKRPVVLI